MGELLQIPRKIIAGTVIVVRRNYSDYPASAGGTLALWIACAGTKASFSAGTSIGSATVDGDDFLVTLDSATTANLLPGSGVYQELLTDSAGIHPVGNGQIDVLPNLATATADSLVDPDEAELALVNQALRTQTQGGMLEYQVGDSHVRFENRREALKHRALLERRIREKKRRSFVDSIPAIFPGTQWGAGFPWVQQP